MKQPLRSEDVAKAEKFAALVPHHLKNDAMLLHVIEQLAEGANFREASVNYIHNYMSTATKPMSPDEYADALGKALETRRGGGVSE